ncbi:endonuclease/exonuclease/phosphatase family protein [Streptomyces phytophilus]|uniref:endonuclease/exonuclease/phosphatase family protein n=1 Tax=Streptomyces phytophilus TaxID=722715 RepID=UPI0015F0B2C6|nr:endonuclease/exonuclease/phosphatase family protein [Streptomyces phytophilus]
MIRVMTWNLWWRFGPWQERTKAILRTLREERPDVVGLQEVWGQGADNLAGWLANELGMDWAWAPSPEPGRWQRRIGDPTVDVGNAVLSRWPIAEQASAVLPAGEEEPDGQQALYARVAAPGGVTVPFFTTHLISYPHASATRSAQVTALARFVHERRGGGDFPPVVTGDFNAEPDSDEMRLLGGTKTAPPVRGQVFLDAWRYAHPTAVGATWDLANPYAARTLEWHSRIDYVLVGPPGPEGEGHVRAVRRAGNAPVDGVWASDHCAVVADLATEAGETAG